MELIDFRFIAFIFGIIVTIFYMYYYCRKVQSDEIKSIVYDIKKEIIKKYIKDKKEIKKDESEIKIDNENNEENFLLKKRKR